MKRDIPAVRILPMSSQIEGFRGKTIEDVQAGCFLDFLPSHEGRFSYRTTGLSAEPGTIILFQYNARIIASAVFLRDEKYARPKGTHSGAIFVDPKSIRTFDPLDADTMRKVWPSFRAFGHVKQFLNPTRYQMLKKYLRNVAAPTK